MKIQIKCRLSFVTAMYLYYGNICVYVINVYICLCVCIYFHEQLVHTDT